LSRKQLFFQQLFIEAARAESRQKSDSWQLQGTLILILTDRGQAGLTGKEFIDSGRSARLPKQNASAR
jgi:hypothetical protein